MEWFDPSVIQNEKLIALDTLLGVNTFPSKSNLVILSKLRDAAKLDPLSLPPIFRVDKIHVTVAFKYTRNNSRPTALIYITRKRERMKNSFA